jgi:very-short-patch-repair endonuclease
LVKIVKTEEAARRISKAKSLRVGQTEAEVRLWYHLRAHRFLGLKFKRQKPLGPYVADFACFEHRLIIEVDGGQHNEERLIHDRGRDAWLATQGFTILRFWNNEVLQNTAAVLERIRQVVELQGPSPPAPLPQAGEGSKSDG